MARLNASVSIRRAGTHVSLAEQVQEGLDW